MQVGAGGGGGCRGGGGGGEWSGAEGEGIWGGGGGGDQSVRLSVGQLTARSQWSGLVNGLFTQQER